MTTSVLDWIETAVLVITLLLLTTQVHAQRKEMRGQQEVLGYEVYQRLVQRYSDHLRLQDENPELNDIYEPIPPARLKEFHTAQERHPPWGAWEIMNDKEKTAFRYTRIALEICEQAWQVYKRGWIDEETWAKWQSWMKIFCSTSYMPFVIDTRYASARARFHEDFLIMLEDITDLPSAVERDQLAQEFADGH